MKDVTVKAEVVVMVKVRVEVKVKLMVKLKVEVEVEAIGGGGVGSRKHKCNDHSPTCVPTKTRFKCSPTSLNPRTSLEQIF
jgi:hypothetical protein